MVLNGINIEASENGFWKIPHTNPNMYSHVFTVPSKMHCQLHVERGQIGGNIRNVSTIVKQRPLRFANSFEHVSVLLNPIVIIPTFTRNRPYEASKIGGVSLGLPYWRFLEFTQLEWLKITAASAYTEGQATHHRPCISTFGCGTRGISAGHQWTWWLEQCSKSLYHSIESWLVPRDSSIGWW